jgi:hypothetical protein
MQTTESTQQIKNSLAQFMGDDIRYLHPLNRKVIYTPGVRYLAQSCEAYWLIDAIASYYGSTQMNHAIKQDSRLSYLQFWTLLVTGQSAVLRARADQDVPPFIEQTIPFTDFPLESVDIWAGFNGSHWTLYLPSEH